MSVLGSAEAAIRAAEWEPNAASSWRAKHRRGWYMRRALALADITGLSIAFVASTMLFADSSQLADHVGTLAEFTVFLATLPLWVLFAKAFGLYDRDDARADHSTADEGLGVLSLVTLGTWVVFVAGWALQLGGPEFDRLFSFWAVALVAVPTCRIAARTVVRRAPAYQQNAVVVGAGHVGQLVARKIQQHPEYGIRLVGFVDERPRDRRPEIADLPMLGELADLAEFIAEGDVDRVIVAFSGGADDERTMSLVRSLRDQEVIIDVVPRLFELLGPRADIHFVEGMPLITVPPARLSRSSFLIKRAIDVVGASILLVVLSPIIIGSALAIRLDSRGPILFRQTRFGMNQRPFTALKFRTMDAGTDDAEHRQFIESTMTSDATLNTNGTYKLQRDHEVTRVGRYLRKASLDELPQLVNVLRGEMSLVGPRPCIPYEVQFFQPHHFDRFLVPQGLTGLWQVTARANSTFGEALEMDVLYVRGWSLGLDLRLIMRTPFALLRQRNSTA